ncbi:nuclease-related domain-containing protein [Streptomyces sp. NPDC050204]|uniref:nuclease-related domain-containing protein n=1 Tax=Streptomyces sp. NPDC050204 TaxID=3155514 RepID=UPI003437B4E5
MSAGQSAQEWADATLRAARPRGPVAWLKKLVGLGSGVPKEAVAQAAQRSAGAEGERRTAKLAGPLALEGWFGLYDRAIPGLHSANADIVLIAPDGTVVVVDAKLWHRRAEVRTDGSRLLHGKKDYSKALRSLHVETSQIREALWDALRDQGYGVTQIKRVSVTPLVAMHNAPVAGGGFTLDKIRVVPADQLVTVLRQLVGRPDTQWAERVAGLAAQLLPRYVEEADQ